MGTAALLGVKHVFEMGGAQAIAAFAFGTRTVPRADRIVGPGNIYVAAAKKLLAGEVGIDFVAGPTEILIIAADGDPRHHRRRHAGAGGARYRRFRRSADYFEAPRIRGVEGDRTPIGNASDRRGRTPGDRTEIPPWCWCAVLDEAVEISNRFAPEHLSIPDESLLAEDQPRGQRVRRAVQSRRPRAITHRVPITCCLPAARRASAEAFPCRII